MWLIMIYLFYTIYISVYYEILSCEEWYQSLSNSKTCVKRPLSKGPKIGFQYQLSVTAGQKYSRMLKGEHSAILLTFIKLPIVI